jgi:hypothetical protein
MARALKKNNFENKINRAGSENVSCVASPTPPGSWKNYKLQLYRNAS